MTLSDLQNFKFISSAVYTHKSVALFEKVLFIVIPQIAHLKYGRRQHCQFAFAYELKILQVTQARLMSFKITLRSGADM